MVTEATAKRQKKNIKRYYIRVKTDFIVNDNLGQSWCQCEVSFKNCTFYSLALKDVYIKHFYDLLAFYWHLADCRSIVVLAPLTHFALLSAQYKSQNLIKQFIKSNLCQCGDAFCLGQKNALKHWPQKQKKVSTSI